MGYMRHHAIVISAGYGDYLEQARAKAIELGMQVTEIVESHTNGVTTFLIIPDGSKEGWSESDAGDGRRDSMKEWLDLQRYEDGSGPLHWVEVQYGDDDRETKVVSHSDEEARWKARRSDLTPNPG